VKVEDVSRIVAKTLVGGEILNDLLIADSCLNSVDCPHRRPVTSATPRAEARGLGGEIS